MPFQSRGVLLTRVCSLFPSFTFHSHSQCRPLPVQPPVGPFYRLRPPPHPTTQRSSVVASSLISLLAPTSPSPGTSLYRSNPSWTILSLTPSTAWYSYVPPFLHINLLSFPFYPSSTLRRSPYVTPLPTPSSFPSALASHGATSPSGSHPKYKY